MKKQKTYPHELIGEKVVVVKAKNKNLDGMEGEIVDETRSTVLIKTKNGVKTVLKGSVDLKLQNLGIIIKGTTIKKRPEERLKG